MHLFVYWIIIFVQFTAPYLAGQLLATGETQKIAVALLMFIIIWQNRNFEVGFL